MRFRSAPAPSRRLLHTLLCGTMALAPLAGHAAPAGGTVQAGAGTIGGQGTSAVTVNQGSSRLVIDWKNFDTGAGEKIRFVQPNANAIALNRVLSGSPTRFDGALLANGRVVVMNANGIVFGPTARIDVAGLVATTADIPTNGFMQGDKLRFGIAGDKDAAIVNHGVINVREAGLAGFVAPSVLNDGVITATLGKAQLAAGDLFTLDLYGDRLVEVAATDALDRVIASNTGVISANGGTVALTAAQARSAVDNLVNNSGVIEATSFENKNGVIILSAAGRNAVSGNVAANKGNGGGRGFVVNSGLLNASGMQKNATGGTVKILGDHVALGATSVVAASGDVGGGIVLVGGDYLGGGVTPTALTTTVSRGSLILNDAIRTGDGGKTIVWSDGTTQFAGSVFGRGGASGGNGGFAETSGKQNLAASGLVDLTAAKGSKGSYLLDPDRITIYGNVDPLFHSTNGSIDLAANLKLWLDASDASKTELTYSNAYLDNVTVSGTAGTNLITVSELVSPDYFVVGSRIRLGAGGAVSLATDTSDANTYTITATSGNTITVRETLSATYSNVGLYRGLVSRLADKSGLNNHAVQTDGAQMPLWVSGSTQSNTQGYIHFVNSARNNLNLIADMNNEAGATNTFLLTMNWNGQTNTMPLGSGTYDLWFHPYSNIFGFNTGNGDAYGINNTALRNGWHQLGAGFYNGYTTNSTLSLNGVSQTLSGDSNQNTFGDTIRIGTWTYNLDYAYGGDLGDIIAYNTAIGSAQSTLLNQYQSAKWNIALQPGGSGATEAAKATAADGYNVFTTRYLERLSNTADVTLQATHGVTLDLQGDTLALATGRSLNLITANGDIDAVSTGTIRTTGGNITATAGGAGNVSLGLVDLTASGANVILNAGGNVSAKQISAGNASITAGGNVNFAAIGAQVQSITNGGTITGGNMLGQNLAIQSGGNISLGNVNFYSGLVNVTTASDITTGALTTSYATLNAGRDISLQHVTVNALGLTAGRDVSLQQVDAQQVNVAAARDLDLHGQLSASAGGNAIILRSGGHFRNHAGATVLQTPNGRALIYSANPDSDTLGGLTGFARRYNSAYAAYAPAAVAGTGNMLLYAADYTLNVTAGNVARLYGDANPALGYSLAGLRSGDTATGFAVGTGATGSSGVGTYGITIGQGAFDNAQNYTLHYTGGTLTITPALLTVTVRDATKTAQTANPVFAYDITGFKNGEDASVIAGLQVTTTATKSAKPGLYAISATHASATNYEFVYVDGALTVKAVKPQATLPTTILGATNTQAPPVADITNGAQPNADATVLLAEQTVPATFERNENAIETAAGTPVQPRNCLYTIVEHGALSTSGGCL